MIETYVWLGILIICIVIEAATLGLTAVWFAFGALITLFISFTSIGVWGQTFIFLLTSSCLLYFTRPISIKYLKIGHTKTNYESLIGKKAIVIEDIDNYQGRGQVKVDGQIWSAKTEAKEVIEKDSKVMINEVVGVKLIVSKEEE